MVMVIYHYVERIWSLLVNPNFCITNAIMKEYYLGEPGNMYIQSSIDMIQDNNWVTKSGET